MRRWRRIGLLLALTGFLLAGVFGCITPPAVFAPGTRPLPEAVQHYPEGTRPASAPVGAGERLRGLFVPAGPNAPVVLHLLGSGGSVASGRMHFGAVAEALQDLGYASLFLDYRGVGDSDGNTSVHHLGPDAVAAFQEAVRLAGGDPGRVVVRAISLGTIAAADLLLKGARPGGVALLLPVRGRDVAWRFADRVLGSFVGSLAWWLAKPVSRAELSDAIAALPAATPVLLVRPDEEPLATDAWLRTLKLQVLARGGGTTHRAGDHFRVGIEANQLLVPQELDFYAHRLALTPPLPAERWRRARVRWAVQPWPRKALDLPPDAAAAWLDLDDPAGRIPLAALEDYAHRLRFIERHAGMAPHESLDQLTQQILARGSGPDGWYSIGVPLSEHLLLHVRIDRERLFEAVLRAGFVGQDAQRVFARILLKAHGYPDRVRGSGQTVTLEAYTDEGWRRIDG